MRNDLERFVYAWNTPLKNVVKTMDVVILLRNAHPLYRAAFASQLKSVGLLSESQAKEFLTFTR